MKKILLIISLFFILSCSTRKVNLDKSNIKIESKENIIEKKDSISQIDTKIVNNIITDEFIIQPIDTTKPIFINNIPYKNAILKHKKTTDNTNTIIRDKVDKIATKITNKSDNKTILTKKKETEKTFSFYNLFWLLIPIIIFVIYKKRFSIFV